MYTCMCARTPSSSARLIEMLLLSMSGTAAAGRAARMNAIITKTSFAAVREIARDFVEVAPKFHWVRGVFMEDEFLRAAVLTHLRVIVVGE